MIMAGREIRLELMLGQRVLGQDGGIIGRIEEVRAEQQGGSLSVAEYHVGADAVLERLSASIIGGAILAVLHMPRGKGGYRVPWNKLDLSDPRNPRLTCAVRVLAKLDGVAPDRTS